MGHNNGNSAIRKGQFLWMEPGAQKRYVETLKRRISEGYYYSEKIFSQVADELAPVLEEVVTTRG